MEQTGVKHYLACIAFSSVGAVQQLYARGDITAGKTLEKISIISRHWLLSERESWEMIFMRI